MLGNPRLTDKLCIFKKNLWEISIKINFNETTPTTHTALQGNNVAKSEYILNGKIQTKHPLPSYTRRWLVTPADEGQGIGAGIMLRLKQRWDKQYLQKNQISKQNLRDNPARFKKELERNTGSEETHIEIEQPQL